MRTFAVNWELLQLKKKIVGMATGYDYTIKEIDGSALEGGGQILRIAIALSGILGIPVRIKNIRAGRPKPGLGAQHLKGVQLVAEMCQARLKGAHLGSTEIEFRPGKIQGGNFYADIQTAGAVSLVLQVALPCALFAPAPVMLELRGGTNVAMAPQIDYVMKVFAPALRRFGGDFCVEIISRGYYPRGGGHVRISLVTVRQLLAARVLERGSVERIAGWSWVAGSLPMPMAVQMGEAVKRELDGDWPVDIHTFREGKDVARYNGYGILLLAETTSGCVLGADGLGTRGLGPADVGRGAACELLAALATGACFDPYALDQVILYMALAAGQSAVRAGSLTPHTRTAIHVVELMTDVRFNVIPLSEENVIQCDGLGVVNGGG